MTPLTRRNLLGVELADAYGEPLGRIVDTYPFDGGGELELVVLRMRRFGERRMLPAAELRTVFGRLRAPYSRRQVEDSPALSTGRHSGDDPERSAWYWRFEEMARPDRVLAGAAR